MTTQEKADWTAYLNELTEYVKTNKLYVAHAGPGENPPQPPPPPPGS